MHYPVDISEILPYQISDREYPRNRGKLTLARGVSGKGIRWQEDLPVISCRIVRQSPGVSWYMACYGIPSAWHPLAISSFPRQVPVCLTLHVERTVSLPGSKTCDSSASACWPGGKQGSIRKRIRFPWPGTLESKHGCGRGRKLVPRSGSIKDLPGHSTGTFDPWPVPREGRQSPGRIWPGRGIWLMPPVELHKLDGPVESPRES